MGYFRATVFVVLANRLIVVTARPEPESCPKTLLKRAIRRGKIRRVVEEVSDECSTLSTGECPTRLVESRGME